MRLTLRSIFLTAIAGGVFFACGSSADSVFNEQPQEEADAAKPVGTFVVEDAGPQACTVAKTCAQQGYNCGKADDGCGNILECGTCNAAAGEFCGGGGTSKCGTNGTGADGGACTPQTCQEIGAACGQQADGCGGIVKCGDCNEASGELCIGRGNQAKCGFGTPNTDGGDGDGGYTCNPQTCTDLGASCGQQSDGCGGLINCGTCNLAQGETCGGAGIPSQCGKACKPITECSPGMNCGAVADGCGGIVSCGPICKTGSCGGAGESNVCGIPSTCTGLCTQQQNCQNGTTSITGTVTSPSGELPIFGAVVFVPTAPVAAFTTGVSCEQCGASATAALVSTTTGPDGKFLLPNMPVSDPDKVTNIPVVIQLGRWRKQITVQTTACATTAIPLVDKTTPTKYVGGTDRPAIDKFSAALPRRKNEGDIPLTAIVTGNVDGLECVFRKLGIDDAEFTDSFSDGRIRFYKDNGAIIAPPVGTCSISGETCTNYGSNCQSTCSGNGRNCSNVGGKCSNRCSGDNTKTCNTLGSTCSNGNGTCSEEGGTCTAKGVCTQTSGTRAASALYNDPDELAKYDMSIFECRGGRTERTATQKANLRDYANKGGRLYATHFSYTWLYDYDARPWNDTAIWVPDTASWGSAIATVDTSFSKGQAFAQWLNMTGGLNTPLKTANPPWTPEPKITINEARHDVDNPTATGAQRWLYTTTTDSPKVESIQHFTFNTDFEKPAEQQCGRVLFSDFHVTTGTNTNGLAFPSECDTAPLSKQEKVLAFMLFDLASCVSPGEPQSQCKPKTCAEQGVQCGQAGDGCGNVITCPNCADGETCGGSGTPSKCGPSTCKPITCPAGTCGKIGDGCGGTVDCGGCATGTCGGAGTPNKCGVGTCSVGVCPAPAVGSQCGPVADGCGGLLSCQCPSGKSCINGKCSAATCVPRTCASAGANCGQPTDGCGGLLNCGTCFVPQTCGGGGIANVCGGGVN